ncbi:MAG: DMT family transporter [Nanoarchaeota archaeon]|nr:DMT family transporter [Nanoarchaeota archaeon]
MDKKIIGILAIIGASLMWALEPIFAKLAYKSSSVFQTFAIRSLCILSIAFLYVVLTNRAKFKINKKQFGVIFYIGIVGTLFADLLYLYSLTKITVLNAVLIAHLQTIFIIIFGFFVLKEKLNKFDYIGIFLLILAGIFVSIGSIENLLLLKLGNIGDLLVLISTIAWATTAIAMKKYLVKMNAGVISFYRALVVSVIFWIYIIFFLGMGEFNKFQFFLGIFVGIGTILYYEGLKRIKAAQVSALELSTPFFSAALGYFVLNEKITLMQAIGLILLILGIYVISKKE